LAASAGSGNHGGGVDGASGGDGDSAGTVLNDKVVGGDNGAETRGAQVLLSRVGAKGGDVGRRSEALLLDDEDNDVSVGTSSLERTGSNVVDAVQEEIVRVSMSDGSQAKKSHIHSSGTGQVQGTVFTDGSTISQPVESLQRGFKLAFILCFEGSQPDSPGW
jgi:hypothetical protein